MSELFVYDLAGLPISNPDLDRAVITPRPVRDGCPTCTQRGWCPVVHAEDCPACLGGDPYGQPVYCAQCEYCCGC